MDSLERINRGRVIRKRRKHELGWSMDIVAKMSKKQLSKSTISNIERGFPGISDEKINLLCSIVGIEKDHIPSLVQQENEWHYKLLRKLNRIEQIIDLVSPEEAHKQLKKISFDTGEPLAVIYHYLDARCHYHKRKYSKASEIFNLTLNLLDNYPEMEHTNIRAFTYKELSRISFFYHNNLEQAVQYTDQGLEAFKPNGERQATKFTLLSSKASYLEKLGRNDEVLKVLNNLEKEQNQWYRNIEVVLNYYEIRANIAAKASLYEDALKFAEEGVELARSNKHHERALELITALGNINAMKKDYDEAEDWYQEALLLEKNINRRYLFITTYTHFGTLYMLLERWDEAKEKLQAAIALAEKSDDIVRYHHALVAFGDYYKKMDDPKTAIIHYEKALEQAKKGGFHEKNPDLYGKLAACYQSFDLGKSEKYMDNYMQLVL